MSEKCSYENSEVKRILDRLGVGNGRLAQLEADLAAAREEIERLEHWRMESVLLSDAADKLREALRQIADDSCVLNGGSRAVFGNDELEGDHGKFYQGYNAGIKSQHELTAKIAKAVLGE